MKRIAVIAGLLAAIAGPAFAQEPGAAPVPPAVRALAGCWQGDGQVMGKPVTMTLSAGPVAENALFVVDAKSQATADPTDRYAAHLIFAGRTRPKDVVGEESAITSFWADSFGGDYTSTGTGAAKPDAFAVSYPYGDQSFVNLWRLAGDKLSWTIVVRDKAGKEETFAAYALTRAACHGGA
ncbi:MAG: hypothetical protein KA105_05105 [Caulobacter sp.]|nr:hypothetical protein [Caulobacter sp.]